MCQSTDYWAVISAVTNNPLEGMLILFFPVQLGSCCGPFRHCRKNTIQVRIFYTLGEKRNSDEHANDLLFDLFLNN